MSDELITIGPWPEGMDTFHSETHQLFQVGGETLPRLVSAVNVDLDDEGRPKRRAGLTEQISVTAGKGVFSGAGLLLVQDGGTIKKITLPSTESTIVSGLDADARIIFHEHAGQIFWSNGIEKGLIDDGINYNWGMTAPPVPTLGTTTGTIPAGRYQVACTLVDSRNRESGTMEAGVITLSGAGGITVDLSSADSNATHVNVYVSSTDQPQLYWQRKITVGALPTTLSTLATDARATERPLRTQFRDEPPLADVIFSYMGYLMVCRGSDLFRSDGVALELFNPQHQDSLPDDVLGAAGLSSGFWRVTATGAWWTTGIPPNLHTVKVDTHIYAGGQKVIPGGLVPKAQTFDLVALFVSEHGLMVATNGQMLRYDPDQHSVDVANAYVTPMIHESGGIRQIIF